MCENVPYWSPAHYWQKKKKPLHLMQVNNVRLWIKAMHLWDAVYKLLLLIYLPHYFKFVICFHLGLPTSRVHTSAKKDPAGQSSDAQSPPVARSQENPWKAVPQVQSPNDRSLCQLHRHCRG